MTDNYSIEALLEFIDLLSRKGHIKAGSASAFKSSCKKFFSALDAEELRDLRNVDIDDASIRFNNKFSLNYDPSSLAGYRNKAQRWLGEFLKWKADPSSYKVNLQTRSRTPKDVVQEQAEKPTQSASPEASSQIVENANGVPHISSNDVPIAIRENTIVLLKGLPFDLSESEARKISNIVLAYANKE